ncbi:MAG TPA: FkbM family methyltransferase [bacterium]|nr:FkbM family methyltransferase [bacterium]
MDTGNDSDFLSVLHSAKPPIVYRANTQDVMAVQGVLLDNEYRLPLRLDPDDVVVDVGAQVGCFLVAVLERGARACYSYEPDPANWPLLVANGGKYGDRAVLRQQAVWGGTAPNRGTLSLSQFPAPYTAMSHCTARGEDLPEAVKVEVQAVSLEAVLREAAAASPRGRVRLLKLDCEGAEYPALLTCDPAVLALVDEIVGETHTLPETANEDCKLPDGRIPDYTDLVGFLSSQGFHAESVPQEAPQKNRWLFARRHQSRQAAKVAFYRFPYGNSESPDCTDWLIETALKCSQDPRVSETWFCRLDGTPITHCRQVAVEHARSMGADLLVMLDNDMQPDLGLKGKHPDPRAKPFWDTSFDYWWQYHSGPTARPAMIGAPYGGPPPHCNMYVFLWRQRQNEAQDTELWLKQYEREEAALLSGIQPCAALPTGVILVDMRVFDLVPTPWFYYEYPDARALKKISTEDVTFSRDASLAGAAVLCNWDAWAGHWKRYLVGRPRAITPDEVPYKFKEAVLQELRQERAGTHRVLDTDFHRSC